MKKILPLTLVLIGALYFYTTTDYYRTNQILKELPNGDVSTSKCRELVDKFTGNYKHEWEFKYVSDNKLCLIKTREFVNTKVSSVKQLYVDRIIDLGLLQSFITVIEYENGHYSYQKKGEFIKDFNLKKYWEIVQKMN